MCISQEAEAATSATPASAATRVAANKAGADVAKKKAGAEEAAKQKTEEEAAKKKAEAEQAAKNMAEEAAAKKKAKATAKAEEEAAAKQQKKKAVREWTVDDVCTFFTELKLGEHTAAITENEVDGRMLQDLLAGDGLGDLGITSKVHALRIKRGLENASADQAKGIGSQAVVCCLHRCCRPRDRSGVELPRLELVVTGDIPHVKVSHGVRPHALSRGRRATRVA